MHRFIVTLLLSVAAVFCASAQDMTTSEKRAARKDMTVKEWNTDARSKTRWLDRVTTYDSLGRKIEETEYTRYGQKWRETYEYGENDKIVKEVLYDERDKPSLIRKYEYGQDLRKVKQYNYSPNGKLQTTKVFEYILPSD